MQQLDLQRIAQDVDSRAKRQLRFGKFVFVGISTFMFVLFNIIAWSIITSLTTGSNAPTFRPFQGQIIGAMTMLAMGWLVTLIYSFLSLFFDTRAAHNSTRNKLMSRAIGGELVRLGLSPLDLLEQETEKRKRSTAEASSVRLTDDGELATDDNTEFTSDGRARSKRG